MPRRLPLLLSLSVAVTGAGGFVACDNVSVVGADAATVEVSPPSVTIELGESTRLQAVVRDGNGTLLGGQSIRWASSDPLIAEVDGSGEVQGVAIGTTTITARAGTVGGSGQIVVEALPGFGLERSTVSLAAASGGTAGPETVLISGTGSKPATGLTVLPVYADGASDWLVLSLSSTSTPASLQLSAPTQGIAPGVYQADVVVNADRVPPQAIRVVLTVSRPPTIGLSSTILSMSVAQGNPNAVTRTVLVSNLGENTIGGLQASVFYAAGQPGNWLTPVLSSTSAPSNLSVSASGSALLPGTYTATVRVSSPDAVNSPQAIAVTLVVGQ